MFRTPKLLGARALISDTFEKSRTSGGMIPDYGAALWAHKDGYNVVYGDYHTAWYGDPQHKITSWPIGVEATYWPSHRASMPDHTMDSTTGLWITPKANLSNLTGAHVVWHMFDEAGGVDVGTSAY